MTIKNIEDLHDEIALEILREWTGDGCDGNECTPLGDQTIRIIAQGGA